MHIFEGLLMPSSVFQMAYTAIFGWYANFLFLRTGERLKVRIRTHLRRFKRSFQSYRKHACPFPQSRLLQRDEPA